MTTAANRQLFSTRYLIDVGAMPNPVPFLNLVVPDAASPDGYRDAVPADYAPDGEKLWEWDPTKVVLYLTDEQKLGRPVTGFDLDREVAAMNPLGPNVGEFLYRHPEEIAKIPGIHDTLSISFMSQKYCDSSVNLYVRFLCWRGERWDWGGRWLGHRWRGGNPPALLR